MHPHTHQVLPSIAFTLGLASSLSALGLAAAFLGQVYGAEAGGTLPTILALASSGLFVAMGLALLEILPLPQLLPSSAARLDQVLACIKVRARQRETGKAEKGRLTPTGLRRCLHVCVGFCLIDERVFMPVSLKPFPVHCFAPCGSSLFHLRTLRPSYRLMRLRFGFSGRLNSGAFPVSPSPCTLSLGQASHTLTH